MVGCRHNAKNSLDKNYLYLAAKQRAEVFAETRVVDVVHLNGKADVEEGYEVTPVSSTSILSRNKRRWRVKAVVFAGSSLGTQDLLFQLRDKKSLPNISQQLGRWVRINAESLIGVRLPKVDNMDEGIAISSGIYLDDKTHIGATGYPRGSDAMSLSVTAMIHGKTDWRRIFNGLYTIMRLLVSNPKQALGSMVPFGLALHTIIMLYMQPLDGHIDML
jgi:cholesterol oxidase